MIASLEPNEVFVFGSNLRGSHGAGAAKQAWLCFGADLGVGEGLTGRCYAFPTLDWDGAQRSDADLAQSIEAFFAVAAANPAQRFLLTKVGCGIAGYDEAYMREKFAGAPANVVLPDDWRN